METGWLATLIAVAGWAVAVPLLVAWLRARAVVEVQARELVERDARDAARKARLANGWRTGAEQRGAWMH